MTQHGFASLALVLSLIGSAGCTSQSVASDGVPGGPGGGGNSTIPTGDNVPKGLRVDDWHIGNGGDLLRKHIIDSQKLSRKILDKIRPQVLEAVNDKLKAVKPFVVKYRKLMASDINQSQFRYFDKRKDKHTQNTCAYTWPEQGQPVVLKYELCKASLRSAYNTTWLVFHEIAHHFQNLPDVAPIVDSMPGDSEYARQEEFADAVAELILDAWSSGRIEWEKIPKDGAPSARTMHSAVWTDESLTEAKSGTEFANSMIIWGGLATAPASSSSRDPINTGAAYSTDRLQWRAISSEGAPSPRFDHDAIWTGTKMLVWGGFDARSSFVFDGGLWDAATDTWQPITYPWAVSSPRPADAKATVQTATLISTKEVLIYGGWAEDGEGNTIVGGIYAFGEKDPAKRWRPIYKTEGWTARTGGHSATFVGKNKVFFFGGYDESRKKTNIASIYDFKANSWEQVEVDPAIVPRAGHTAVYSSHGVIIFGRYRKASGVSHLHGTGAFYDIHSKKKDKWTMILSQSAPERYDHTAVWTGGEMMVFGGKAITGRGTLYSSIAKFNPSNMGWSSVSSNYDGPEMVQGHTAVWTGYSMMVWGGQTRVDGDVTKQKTLDQGFIYYP